MNAFSRLFSFLLILTASGGAVAQQPSIFPESGMRVSPFGRLDIIVCVEKGDAIDLAKAGPNQNEEEFKALYTSLAMSKKCQRGSIAGGFLTAAPPEYYEVYFSPSATVTVAVLSAKIFIINGDVIEPSPVAFVIVAHATVLVDPQ